MEMCMRHGVTIISLSLSLRVKHVTFAALWRTHFMEGTLLEDMKRAGSKPAMPHSGELWRMPRVTALTNAKRIGGHRRDCQLSLVCRF